MNKINLYLILFFTSTGIYTIQPSATLNWPSIMQAVQSTQNVLGNFTSVQNQSATSFQNNYGGQNQDVYDADRSIGNIYQQIRAIIDLYNQSTTSSDPEYQSYTPCTPPPGGMCSQTAKPGPISNVAAQFGGPLQSFYKAIQGSNNAILPASQYNNQAIQSLATCFTNFAQSLAQLSVSMTNDINSDNTSISNDTSVDPSSNPINGDILRCQVIQDLSFVCNNIFIFLANKLLNTPTSATILYTPEISCSDMIATYVFAVINIPAGTSADSLDGNLLSGSVSATIPTTPTTIAITQQSIYAAVCGFVNSYDANSTTGPYQPIIDGLIDANNAVQSL